ncbi:MAG TPA: haloalkane dehalogenase, partial [Dehalococcoidia bacterium]|nr:haloalkane dehalogenase [Dehalococcoidia bacterium]
GDPILMLHGEPTWGYLYRRMIPALQGSGRVIVPDLVGFGRSDKPAADNAYSYRSHVRWLRKLVEALELERITLVCQDWGGLLGLRVVAQAPERFARLVVMNTGLPDGRDLGPAFLRWRRFAQQARELHVGAMLSRATGGALSPGAAAAYDAPFPDASYQTGALVFPRLVPTHSDDPGTYDNRRAREALRSLDLPVLTVYGTGDAITGPWEEDTRGLFRNVALPVHLDAGHFLQETHGEQIAVIIRDWMATATRT